ncbi:MAG: ion channel [Sulfuricaulis sp.]
MVTDLHFSAETYTSIGFGDIYPLGTLRMIAGIEAPSGLLLIGWSASFTYLAMLKFWYIKERD